MVDVTAPHEYQGLNCDDPDYMGCSVCGVGPGAWVHNSGRDQKERRKRERQSPFPHDAKARKEIPIKSGFLDYFPSAIALVAQVSKKGNDKHNPGQPIHWARGKSSDQGDSALRHQMEEGCLDPDTKLPVEAHAIWRMLAALQLKCEAEGAPRAPGAWTPEEEEHYLKTGELP